VGSLDSGQFLQRAVTDPARANKPMAVIASAVGESLGRIMTRSSRNRLKAVLDLIFDALPDLVGAHVRIFH
jgi:hypothetical protein